MKDIDLVKLIQQGNRGGGEETIRQSIMAALAVCRGENVGVLSPDEDSAKEFITEVKKRLKELGLGEPSGKIERIKPPKRGKA